MHSIQSESIKIESNINFNIKSNQHLHLMMVLKSHKILTCINYLFKIGHISNNISTGVEGWTNFLKTNPNLQEKFKQGLA